MPIDESLLFQPVNIAVTAASARPLRSTPHEPKPPPAVAADIGGEALILLCQFGEVCDEDGEESAGEVALDAADDFAV